jgi:outer membrane protein
MTQAADRLAAVAQFRRRSPSAPFRRRRKPGRTAPLLVASFVLAAAPVVRASAQDVLRLTLEDAQARALQASHRLGELQAREAAALATADVRAAAGRPNVALMAGYTRTNHVTEFVVPAPGSILPRVLYPDVPDNWRTRLDLQWPIYTGGRIDALERAARAEAAAVGADLAAARADLRLEVARAFWALVTARSAVAVLERAVERANTHVEDVVSRLDAGLVPPNEVASAQAQASRERMLLIEAGNQRDLASSELARLIGETVLRGIEPVGALDAPVATLAQGEALVADARAARSERQALERRIEAAEERRLAAAAGKLPAVSVGGGFDYARPNPRIFPRADRWDDSWDASVNVAWSLWDGGRTKAEVAEAAAGAAAVRQRLEEFDSVLALELRQRLLEIESGQGAIAAANDAVRSAEEARRVVAERFAAGVVTHTEVLDAQLAVLQAELDRTRALANVRLAEARLARAAGR